MSQLRTCNSTVTLRCGHTVTLSHLSRLSQCHEVTVWYRLDVTRVTLSHKTLRRHLLHAMVLCQQVAALVWPQPILDSSAAEEFGCADSGATLLYQSPQVKLQRSTTVLGADCMNTLGNKLNVYRCIVLRYVNDNLQCQYYCKGLQGKQLKW